MPQFSTTAIFKTSQQLLELTKLEIPPLQKGEILVCNEYTSLCKSDLHTYTGKRQEKSPTILGHETVGRIVGFGESAPTQDGRGTTLQINDRISWAIFSSDPHSVLSQKGIPQKAENLFKYGHEQLTATCTLHGGLSQYTILRPNTPIVKLDETIPVQLASIINCSVATVAGALRLAEGVEGKTLLVSGAGMLGMVACAMAKTQGATTVVALDVDKQRLAWAKAFGADIILHTSDDLDKALKTQLGVGNPIDIVLEMSGVPDAIENTLDLLAIGGMAVWVGAVMPQRKLAISAEQIVRKLQTIRGLHNYNSDDFIAAVLFMEKYHLTFPFDKLIHDEFCLNDINEAFAYALHHNPFRVGVRIS